MQQIKTEAPFGQLADEGLAAELHAAADTYVFTPEEEVLAEMYAKVRYVDLEMLEMHAWNKLYNATVNQEQARILYGDFPLLFGMNLVFQGANPAMNADDFSSTLRIKDTLKYEQVTFKSLEVVV